MPTGWRSVYLCAVSLGAHRRNVGYGVPARDLERRAENLGAHKFSHGEGWSRGICDRRKWE